jgi:hypothetical protein
MFGPIGRAIGEAANVVMHHLGPSDPAIVLTIAGWLHAAGDVETLRSARAQAYISKNVGTEMTQLFMNAFANLGWDEIRMTHPVFAGDTLFSESLVLEKRTSASRPHAGIVTVRTRTLNQDGDEVCSFKRTFYVYRRGAEQVEGTFPDGKRPLTAEGV